MNLIIKRTIKTAVTPDVVLEYLLKDRKVSDQTSFINPPHPKEISLADFFEKKTFKEKWGKITKLLKDIHEEGKMIVVYTDYDADGITGGAILWQTLHSLGFKVMPYVPDRKSEGYGFSKTGLDKIKKQFAPALIISVDHGIVAQEKISYAAKIGIPIIVTDHHQKGETEPAAAFAVFHTDKLSGSGVAYFFAKEVYENFKFQISNFKLLEKTFSSDYLALASIGTIADLVPLVGPSRSVVKHGLLAFSNSQSLGLRYLIKESQIEGRPITPYEVGFIIAPRINAFGRIGDATDALRLLCSTNEGRAKGLAQKAGQTNTLRQKMVQEAVLQAHAMVDKGAKIIILENPQWEEGILGLIASKMVEKYYRPAIIMTRSDGQAKASARSISGFNITKFLRSLKSFLIDVGGHPAAAGFTMEAAKITAFTKAAVKSAATLLTEKDLVPKMTIDLEIPLESVTINLARELENLAPFGIGNPRPVFLSAGKLITTNLIGKNKDHLKIAVRSKNSFPMEILFFGGKEKMASLSTGADIKVAYTIEINKYNGRETVQGIGKDLIEAPK